MPSIVGGWQGNSFVINAIPKKIKKRSPPRMKSGDTYILYSEQRILKGADRVSLSHINTFQFHEYNQAVAWGKRYAKILQMPIILAVKPVNKSYERQIARYLPSRKK